MTARKKKKEKKEFDTGESGYTCPFCGGKKSSPEVICKCEVENTGMYEFWKD